VIGHEVISGLAEVYLEKRESLPGMVYFRFISGLSEVYLEKT
jgi:hypothetical protein